MTATADTLRVAALSLDITARDKAANLQAACHSVRSLPDDVTVAVLPELFSTGFVADHTEALALAETNEGHALTALADIARERSIAICGSHLGRDEGIDNVYNRCFLLLPDGSATFYDKGHLFFLGDECNTYTPGLLPPPVTHYLGWNLAMACCFDLRFPCWLRNRGLGYDAMLLPANWPRSRSYAWTHLLIARAIENQAYYVGANRGGGKFAGLSMIVDYEGKPISEEIAPGVTVATLRRDQLEAQRANFPAWKSAD